MRWRQLLPTLAQEGLTPEIFQETVRRLAHSQKLVDDYVEFLMNQYITISPCGYAIVENKLLEESPEAVEEIFKRVLGLIGSHGYPVRATCPPTIP